MTFTQTIGLDVSIEILSYTPFFNGRTGHIDNWMPDEPESAEISVSTLDGIDITNSVDDDTLAELEIIAIDIIKDRYDDNN